MTLLLLILLVCFSAVCSGQPTGRGSVWHLSGRLSLDFKSDPPKISNDSKIRGGGSRTSAITDEFGNLLLYTDGDSIWNSAHEPIENGFGLNEYLSADPATAVIVPHPGDGELYYVFIANRDADLNFQPSAFIYATVDMSANEGCVGWQ
jgi:hypothetical protein